MVREGLTAFALGALGALVGCASPDRAPEVVAPPAPREFRGAWVASVANIDWPSRAGLPAAQQQEEIVRIVERARSLGLNALIVQVRPAADALYASALEPWSEYLTGEQGKAPEPFYDPLAFWIAEAHRRGLELHAWFNPYRARHSSARSPIAPGHIANTAPAIVKPYGNMLWLDPGEPRAAERTLEVIVDVVRRYDIDGVHIDDYFYPYPVTAPNGSGEVEFPDDSSWQRYLASGGTLARDAWRRRNVDRLVEDVHAAIHREKPWVRFGVSPFGLGRPDRRPAGLTGFSQYDKLYADVERWLSEGWLDYLAPQLYWPIESPGQPFAPLLDYWMGANTALRHVWPGLFTSRINDTPTSWSAAEIATQVALGRAQGAGGHIHFSMIALMENRRGVADALRPLYESPALVPASAWLADTLPAPPEARVRIDANAIVLEVPPRPGAWLIAIWARYGDLWRFFVVPASAGSARLDARIGTTGLDAVVLSAVSRTGVESSRATLTLP